VIYTFNGRTGLMAELDLRMNLNMITQHQLSQSQEITAVCLNQTNDTLITGYKDDHVKIHSTHQYYESNETRDMKLREKIEAFPFDFRSKKGLVQRIKINQKNGGLFASSQSGTLKLLSSRRATLLAVKTPDRGHKGVIVSANAWRRPEEYPQSLRRH
jgi:hypothetical protein